MRLSKHSIQRMRERANITRNQKSFFRNALQHGKSPLEIKDEQLKNRLISISMTRNTKVKLYKGYVFIYSKNKHILYTMYKLEEI